MIDQLPPLENEQKLSRRNFLKGAMAATALAVKTLKLVEVVSSDGPSLEVRTIPAGRLVGDVQLFSENTSEMAEEKIMTITPEGRLLFEPSGVFFTPGKEFNYVHRGGNNFESIDEAYYKGANLFDIDANDIDGDVRGDHGIVPQLELHLGRRSMHLYLPAVFDINEKRLEFGMPSTYEELIAHIAYLSTAENPLAVSVEAKRGKFELDTLIKMFTVHQEYNVPAIMHSQDQQRLMLLGGELASLYNMH